MLALIGYGGVSREIAASIKKTLNKPVTFFISDYLYNNLPELDKQKVNPISIFDPNLYKALVTIADPITRYTIVTKELPKTTEYFTYIHPSVQIIDTDSINIGIGSIIYPNVVLTTNINIGDHCIVNINATIGHDTIINNYCTISPAVNISGNNKIGSYVFFGTNSATKENIKISNNIIIGFNAGVTKDLTESGTYIGTPAILSNSYKISI
jgi:sugar O-acyltransferase (sialic acid O-acetyltransferase NeuD family)